MAKQYFEDLRNKCAKIDEGIVKLEETWKLPHLLTYECNENSKIETRKIISHMKTEISSLKEKIKKDKDELSRLKEFNKLFHDEFIAAFNDLKEPLDEVKYLFRENGYQEEIDQDNLHTNESNDSRSDYPIKHENAESALVESLRKLDFNNSTDSIEKSFNANSLKLEKLPLNKQTKIVKEMRPLEPHYSPQFYKIIKKT